MVTASQIVDFDIEPYVESRIIANVCVQLYADEPGCISLHENSAIELSHPKDQWRWLLNDSEDWTRYQIGDLGDLQVMWLQLSLLRRRPGQSLEDLITSSYPTRPPLRVV